MKFFIKLLIFAAIVGGGYYYWQYRQQQAAAAGTLTAVVAKPIEVQRGDIDLRVSTTGKVASNLDVEIKSKASGEIISLPFDVSDKVTTGDLLAELLPVDEERNVAQREASLASTRARMNQAKENLRVAIADVETGTSTALTQRDTARVRAQESVAKLARANQLFQSKLISSEEVDAARTEASSQETALQNAEIAVQELRNLASDVELRRQDILLQESEVKRAQIDMDNALQRLSETKIFAPMEGVVTSRPVQTGQIIASGISNVGGGTTLMTVSDLARLFVNASVDESDIGKIAVNQRATITADAFPGRRFSGEVVRVAAKGETNSNVVTFQVKIEVGKEGLNTLLPEMTANVDIQADRRENALILPNEAIQFGGREGYFVVLAGGETSGTRQSIKPGITDGLNTEVVSGLEEGQNVQLPANMQSRWTRGGQAAGGGGGGQGGGFASGMQRAARGLTRGGR